MEEWRPVFWISAIIFFSSTILFWIFGSGEVQSWNESLGRQVVPDEEKEMTGKKRGRFLRNVEDISADEAEENARL